MIRMGNFRLTLLLLLGLTLSNYSPALAKRTSKKSKGKTEQTDTPKPKESKYKKTFSSKNGCVSARGSFLSLHKTGGKLYIEIPKKYLNREVLIAATVTGTSDSNVATIGYKARQPFHGRFTERDSCIFLERISVLPDADPSNPDSERNIRLANLNPIIGGGEIVLRIRRQGACSI